MKRRSYMLLLTACLLATVGSIAAQEISPEMTKKIDAIFSEFPMPDTPGCALAIYRGGRIIYAKGYGCADLEHAVPIRSNSVFNIGSMSKQFTAASLILLQQDGKLSLDDEVRKYLPELPDYGHPITIRHLLNHTSGLRDYLGLLGMAGFDDHDVSTDEDALRVIVHQRGLDFDPGTKHAYSNTGYFLISQIIKRVSGKSLKEFAAERIFTPLGMTHTFFVDDHNLVIPNRAIAYDVIDGKGFSRAVPSWQQTGDGGLNTTVEDLVKWDENFYSPKVGGPTLVKELQRRGVLNNGDTINYAEGLYFGEVRGLKTVEHGGADGGYRAQFMRIPAEHFSVVILANCAAIDPVDLSRKVTEVALADRLPKEPDSSAAKTAESAPVPKPVVAKIDTARFASCAGDFTVEAWPGFVFTFKQEGGRYFVSANGHDSDEMFPESDSVFFLGEGAVKFFFHRVPGHAVDTLVLLNDEEYRAHRVVIDRTPVDLKPYLGTYRSPELLTEYTLAVEDGKLVAKHSHRGMVTLVRRPTIDGALVFNGDNEMMGKATFDKGEDGNVKAMLVTIGRNKNIRFDRVP